MMDGIVQVGFLEVLRVYICGCQNGVGGLRHALGLTYIDGTCVEMIRANTLRSNNTSGVQGVDWLAKKQRWRATICFKGKRRCLGSYEKFEDAVKARKRGEEEYHDKFLEEFDKINCLPRKKRRQTPLPGQS